MKQWQREVFITLCAVHAAEEYQRWYLIVHDHAVSQNRPTVLLRPGDQYDLRSASLLDCDVGDSVQW
jgi:hypothetical protein